MGLGVTGVTQVNSASTAHPNPPVSFLHILSYESSDGSPSLHSVMSPEKETGPLRSWRIWAVMLIVVVTLKAISRDRLRTAGLSHNVQTHDLEATVAKGLEVTGSNLQTSRIHLHLRAMHLFFVCFNPSTRSLMSLQCTDKLVFLRNYLLRSTFAWLVPIQCICYWCSVREMYPGTSQILLHCHLKSSSM